MIHAELSGKISHNKPPNQVMEDVLTSYAFSLLRYFDTLKLAQRFLCEARNREGERLSLDIGKVSVLPWPRFALPGANGFREADALLLVYGKKRQMASLIVESKYRSGLSNRNTSSDDVGEPNQGDELGDENVSGGIELSHQLADEYCATRCGIWHVNPKLANLHKGADQKLMLYVTTHYELPTSELDEATRVIRESRNCPESMNCSLASIGDIYWISWRVLHEVLVLELEKHSDQYRSGEKNLIKDMTELLELRGLNSFSNPFQRIRQIEKYDCILSNSIWRKLFSVEPYKAFHEN